MTARIPLFVAPRWLGRLSGPYGVALLIAGVCLALPQWRLFTPADPARFAAYLILAALASGLPLKTAPFGVLPNGLPFLLIAMMELPVGESLMIGAACTAVAGLRTYRHVGVTRTLGRAGAILCGIVTAQMAHLFSGLDLLWLMALTAAVILWVFSSGLDQLAGWLEGLPRNVGELPGRVTGLHVALAALGAVMFRMLNDLAGWQFSLLLLPSAYLLARAYTLHRSREQDHQQHSDALAALHLRTIEALALAIDAKDDTTHNHLQRVQVYALGIGEALNLPPAEMEALRVAALLHDIGKLAIPERILSKPGRLTPDEFERMKQHTVIGAQILEKVQFPFPVTPIVRSHHEKWDGTGYPDGLRGEQIPIGARILSVVDTLDALASHRQYRRALPMAEALRRVEAESGRGFDPQVVQALLRHHSRLEAKAKAADGGMAKISRDMRIIGGLAPAAGFENSEARESGASDNPTAALLRLRQRLDRLDKVRQSVALGPGEFFPLLLPILGQHLPAEAVALYSNRGRHLECLYAQGEQTEVLHALQMPLGEGLCGWVADTGRPIVNGNPAVEPGYAEAAGEAPYRSALCVPILQGHDVVGVLAFYHSVPDAFARTQVVLAELVAARLIGIVQERNQDRIVTEAETELARVGNADTLAEAFDDTARTGRGGLVLVLVRLSHLDEVLPQLPMSQACALTRRLSDALRLCLGPDDAGGYLGQGEFAVLVQSDDLPNLWLALAGVSTLYTATARVIQPLATIQMVEASYPDDGADLPALLVSADQKMRHRAVKLKQPQPKSAIAGI